jgi:excisionase family DNA binding protein
MICSTDMARDGDQETDQGGFRAGSAAAALALLLTGAAFFAFLAFHGWGTRPSQWTIQQSILEFIADYGGLGSVGLPTVLVATTVGSLVAGGLIGRRAGLVMGTPLSRTAKVAMHAALGYFGVAAVVAALPGLVTLTRGPNGLWTLPPLGIYGLVGAAVLFPLSVGPMRLWPKALAGRCASTTFATRPRRCSSARAFRSTTFSASCGTATCGSRRRPTGTSWPTTCGARLSALRPPPHPGPLPRFAAERGISVRPAPSTRAPGANDEGAPVSRAKPRPSESGRQDLNLRPLGPEILAGASDTVGSGPMATDVTETTEARGSCRSDTDGLRRPGPAASVTSQAQRTLDTYRLLTVRQVAERLQVCRATVYRLVAGGQLPAVRVSSGAIRVRDSGLLGQGK